MYIVYLLLHLAAPIAWFALLLYVSRSVYLGTQSRLYAMAAGLVVILVPLWDVIPGLILYRQAISELGGVRISRTVEASGYLNHRTGEIRSRVWILALTTPYQYVEYERQRPDRDLEDLTRTPGFYQFSLRESGDPLCGPFNTLPRAEQLRARYGMTNDQCVAVAHSDQPVSQYEFLWVERAYRDSFPAVGLEGQVIRDRLTGEEIATAFQVHYKAWLSRSVWFIPWFSWLHSRDDGNAILLQAQDVISPVDDG